MSTSWRNCQCALKKTSCPRKGAAIKGQTVGWGCSRRGLSVSLCRCMCVVLYAVNSWFPASLLCIISGFIKGLLDVPLRMVIGTLICICMETFTCIASTNTWHIHTLKPSEVFWSSESETRTLQQTDQGLNLIKSHHSSVCLIVAFFKKKHQSPSDRLSCFSSFVPFRSTLIKHLQTFWSVTAVVWILY